MRVRRCVDWLPSTGATCTPPLTAIQAQPPDSAARSSTAPVSSSTLCQGGSGCICACASGAQAAAPPATATRTGPCATRSRSAGPRHSRQAACGGLPTSALAAPAIQPSSQPASATPS